MTVDFEEVEFDSVVLRLFLIKYKMASYTVKASRIEDSDCHLIFVNIFSDNRIAACLRWDSRRDKLVTIKAPPSRAGEEEVMAFVAWLKEKKSHIASLLEKGIQRPQPSTPLFRE